MFFWGLGWMGFSFGGVKFFFVGFVICGRRYLGSRCFWINDFCGLHSFEIRFLMV